MTEMCQFVDEIFRDYKQYSDNFEEDQMLSSRESLYDVCRILLNVSCLPEEGRYSSFRMSQGESGESGDVSVDSFFRL